MREVLLNFLCCPICKGELKTVKISYIDNEITSGYLLCKQCNMVFPIENGIPNMLVKQCFGLKNTLSKVIYDLYAPIYDPIESRLINAIGFSEKILRETIVSRMNIKNGDCILEICVGTGANIPFFLRRKCRMIVGLDISKEMIKQCLLKAKRLNWKNVELVLGCAEYLPFKSNVFDKVLIRGAISYFSNPRLAISEAIRVTKPRGQLVIFEQLTILEKLLRKDLIPILYKPINAKLLSFEYLLRKNIYIATFQKTSL